MIVSASITFSQHICYFFWVSAPTAILKGATKGVMEKHRLPACPIAMIIGDLGMMMAPTMMVVSLWWHIKKDKAPIWSCHKWAVMSCFEGLVLHVGLTCNFFIVSKTAILFKYGPPSVPVTCSRADHQLLITSFCEIYLCFPFHSGYWNS